ncbi:MAG: hypothetical protein IPP13_21515 [Kouleothrix sp.]|jgi:hypothetical protein|nr:hypothetical protein [Kouleothrix sp.]
MTLDLLSNPLVGLVALVIAGAIIRVNRKLLSKAWWQEDERMYHMGFFEHVKTQLTLWGFTSQEPEPLSVRIRRELEQARSNQRSESTRPVAPAPRAEPVRDTTRASYQPINLDTPPSSIQTIRLSTIAQEQNVLVTGPKGSGKTTILRTILNQRIQTECIAIDPHNEPGKWPCQSVGGGLDWTAISRALGAMTKGMHDRFQQLNQGVLKSGCFPQRTFIADEFLAITQELDGRQYPIDAGKALISRLTQGRKVGECVLIAAQSDTVQSLGIKGNSDLKSCFDYLIFLGGNIATRAKFHGCPDDVAQEAFRQKRPSVVWHPERNNWYVLLHDLEPVLEGDMSIVSSVVPIGSQEPVPDIMPKNTGSEHGNQYREPAEPVPGADGMDDEIIKALHSSGWSNNRIAERMKGRREDRLARIRKALADDVDVVSE